MIEVFNQMKDNRPFVPLMKAKQSHRLIDNFFVNTFYEKIKSLEVLKKFASPLMSKHFADAHHWSNLKKVIVHISFFYKH